MANTIAVQLRQMSATTTEATVRSHTVLIDRPLEKEGTDRGPMGGELLLAALGGCFMSNLLAAVRARQANIANIRVDVTGTLESNPARIAAVTMQITADYDNVEQFEKLVTIAERACISANTLKAGIDLSIVLE
jgi:putative redox protein